MCNRWFCRWIWDGTQRIYLVWFSWPFSFLPLVFFLFLVATGYLAVNEDWVNNQSFDLTDLLLVPVACIGLAILLDCTRLWWWMIVKKKTGRSALFIWYVFTFSVLFHDVVCENLTNERRLWPNKGMGQCKKVDVWFSVFFNYYWHDGWCWRDGCYSGWRNEERRGVKEQTWGKRWTCQRVSSTWSW